MRTPLSRQPETLMQDQTHRFVHANRLRMHVVEQGEGPVVLLCHGFPETWYSWRHQLPALAEAGFRAVAPDLRGYGATDRPSSITHYSLFHLVGDMVALLDALDTDTAVIVGNDWGATLAWQAVLMRPDRFRAIVALGVPMLPRSPMPPTEIFPRTEAELFYALYFQEPGVAEAEFDRNPRSTLLKLMFAASGDAGSRKPVDGTPNPFGMVAKESGLLASLPDPGSVPAWLSEADLDVAESAFKQSGFAGGLNYYRNMDHDWELQASLAGMKVQVPALYLAGERDVGLAIPGMRELIDSMPERVPALCKSEFVAGGGHWLQQEKAGEVNTALVSFLSALA